jgi:nucleotide-binding universal stress UspA family protein
MEKLEQGTLTRRKFLCVVDDSPECRLALRFAFRRAARTGGGVVLLYVIEPADFQHWVAVGNLMREEAREAAEEVLHTLADEVSQWSGIMPEFAIREGRKQEQVITLLDDEPEIRLLVLGASAEKDGPGPLVTALAGLNSGDLRVPITVVPGTLSIEQIDEIT